ncbi:hypothetical protein P168DRAFT_330077 [Aspergillus campestris IBT 28561]|uniref:Uncharacterized protein n=1 Tax=Aspergillus campestris (strain IBT 28561) TaxID=1392248 RepID=A0A2I1CT20_ASPC2|nr:uncharacterized protein P168DRAFT_330077 [Aspergillus campestris IBT 28561]PKY00757.1 hypothetical protein P168DRAFT_330077 [Aspergillus campestris IBT 28561]
MAASFGENLLKEIHEEGLDEIFCDLRTLLGPSPRLGADALDGLVEVFMPVGPVPAVERTVPVGQDEQEEVQPEALSKKRHDPVVEISSASSAAGKSQILYYLTAMAVLPSTFNGASLGGCTAAVVYIDTDGRFDAERLQSVARGIVKQKAGQSDHTGIETTIATTLQHVHVFRPQSSCSLLATLQTLDTYLLDLTRHHSAPRPLHAIFLDSASAFFWPDRLRDEVARIEDIGRPYAELERERRMQQSFHISDLYAALVAELRRLQRRFGCTVVYTTTVTTGRPPASNPASGPFDLYNPGEERSRSRVRAPSLRPLLPGWGAFPTLRLVVGREAVRAFPSGTTVHGAQRAADARQDAVRRGQFWARANAWGEEDWPQRVVERIQQKGGFSFTITEGVVTI